MAAEEEAVEEALEAPGKLKGVKTKNLLKSYPFYRRKIHCITIYYKGKEAVSISKIYN